MSIDLGSTYRSVLTVRDGNGNLVNPGTVILTATNQADAVPHTVTTANPSTGMLTGDYQPVTPGLWRFDWVTTSPGVAQTDYISVRSFRSLFSLAEARDYLAVGDNNRDQAIRWCMATATRQVERIVGTCVSRSFTDWIGTAEDREALLLPHGPLVSRTAEITIASVWPGGPSWSNSAGELAVNEYAATVRLNSRLWFWWGPWRATYTGGRAEISEDIETGAKEILWDLWATQRGNLTDQQEPSLEEVAAFEAQYTPPGRAMELLEAERRPGFG